MVCLFLFHVRCVMFNDVFVDLCKNKMIIPYISTYFPNRMVMVLN